MSLLKNIVTFEKGKKYDLLENYEDGAIRVFQANDFRNEDKPQYTFQETGVEALEDDILVVWDGSVGQMGFGKTGYVGSTIVRLRVKDKSKFDPYFVFKFLQTKAEYLKNKSTGATIKHINRKSLEQIDIPEMTIAYQKHVANILSKADILIAQRKESIALLDEFLKGAFLEMFGDPILNKKGWPLERLDNLAKLERGRFSPRPRNNPIYYNGAYPFIQTGDISKSEYRLNNYTQTLNENGIRVSKEFKKGTIVIAIVGATIGATAILELDVYATDSIIGISADKTQTNEQFLEFTLRFWKPVLLSIAPEAARANINLAILNKLKFPNPPIELQTQFAQIVEKTEALKTQYRQSLQELENLYGSLSQRAFRGELTIAQPVKQKRANISDKALLAFYQKQIIGHVIKKHQEHRMEQGEIILAKDLYHLEALYGIKTHFQFKNWHYGTYDPKIRKLINGKDKYFTKKSVGQKGFQVLALGEKSDALFKLKYPHKELEFIGKAMDELLDLYASFPIKERSHKIELLNTVCKSIVDAQSTELAKVREIMKQWKTTKAGFKNKAEKFSEQETDEMIELIINKEWDKKLL